MSKLGKLIGIPAFVGIVCYWYFVPYSLYLASIKSQTIWPSLGNAPVLWFTISIGITLTTLLGAFTFWIYDRALY